MAYVHIGFIKRMKHTELLKMFSPWSNHNKNQFSYKIIQLCILKLIQEEKKEIMEANKVILMNNRQEKIDSV